MKYKDKQFTSRYNRLMLLSFVVVIAISIALVTLKIYTATEHEHTQLVEKFKTHAIAIDNLIVSVIEHLTTMQTEAEAFFLSVPSERSTTFKALANVNNGEYYSLDNIPPPYTEINLGNLTGANRISDAPLSLQTEIEMALRLNPLFQATQENIPNAAWIYYTSKNKFINIYPWVHSSEFKFSEDLYTHEFYIYGFPGFNPEKKRFWTSAYIDEYGKGMMVTAAQPVYRDNGFLGTVAIDITLDKLSDYVRVLSKNQGTLMVINDKKQLIAHPTLTSSKDKTIKSFELALPSVLQAHKDKLLNIESQNLSKYGNYLYLNYKMENAPWHIVFIAKQQSFFMKFFSTISIIFIILLAGLSFMLLNLKRLTYREFIYPAESLVRHIYQESQDKPITIPNVPKQWSPWCEEVSKAFAKNRNLIAEIKQKNEQLTDINIALERYMPKFVLILSLKRGAGSTTIGNFFADALSKLDDSKATVYMEYPMPEYVIDDFSLNKEEPIYHHPNGYDIWSSYELGDVPDNVKTSLLMTKILNSYNNVVINTLVQEPIEKFIPNEIEPILKYAKAIVVMASNNDGDDIGFDRIDSEIKKYVRRDQTNIFWLYNKITQSTVHSSDFNFEIPYLSNRATLSKEEYVTPTPAVTVISSILDRIERVHQISVYIPTTIDIDRTIDTSDYVNRTIVFLGAKFGDATSSQAHGVWNSDTLGIVSEVVHIVVTYTTEKDLNLFVNEVIEFVKNIKQELNQDAMAIEINKKMILI